MACVMTLGLIADTLNCPSSVCCTTTLHGKSKPRSELATRPLWAYLGLHAAFEMGVSWEHVEMVMVMAVVMAVVMAM